jgi:hypothetical protein
MQRRPIWIPLCLLSGLLVACGQQGTPMSPGPVPALEGSTPGAPHPPGGMPAASPNAAQSTSASVFTHASQGPVTLVPGAIATLVTNDSGAHMTVRTSGLAAGHPHTVWFVAVNQPDQCLTRPCTPTDILFRTATVQAEVVYLTGSVVGNNGMAGLGGSIRAGVVPNGWFGNGFTNPRGAEIHLILMDHGPKIPDLVANQISTLRGGCTSSSIPAAFPPAAFADGIPGPNTCRLVQFAVLEQ